MKMGDSSLAIITAEQLTRSVSRAFNNHALHTPIAKDGCASLKPRKHRRGMGTSIKKCRGVKKYQTKVADTKAKKPGVNHTVRKDETDSAMKKTDMPTLKKARLPSSHLVTPTRFILPHLSDRVSIDELIKHVRQPIILVPATRKDTPRISDVTPEVQNPEAPKQLRSCNAGNHVQIPSDLYASASRKLPCNLSEILSSSSVNVCDDGRDSVSGLSSLETNIDCSEDLISSQTLRSHQQPNSLSRNIFEFETDIRQSNNTQYDLQGSEMIQQDAHLMSITDRHHASELTNSVAHDQFLHLHQDTSKDSDFGRLVIAHQSENSSNSFTRISLPESSQQDTSYDTMYHSARIAQNCYTHHMQQVSTENSHYANLSLDTSNSLAENSHFSNVALHQSSTDNSQFSEIPLHNNSNTLSSDGSQNYQHLSQNETAYSTVYPQQNARDHPEYRSFSIHNDNTLQPITDDSEIEYSNLSANTDDDLVSEQNLNQTSYCHPNLSQPDDNTGLVYPESLDTNSYEPHNHAKSVSTFRITPLDLSRVAVTNPAEGTYDSISTHAMHPPSLTLTQPICHSSEYHSVARLLTSPKIGNVAGHGNTWNNSVADQGNRCVPSLPVLDVFLKSQSREKQTSNERQRLVVPYELSRLLSANQMPVQPNGSMASTNPLSLHCQQLLSISNELQHIANQINCNSQAAARLQRPPELLANESQHNLDITNEQADHENQSGNSDGLDETNYCVECNLSYLTPCTTHNITYTPIPDAPVLSKARLSLPPQLCLKPSQTTPNSIGVWCAESIARYTRFGPMIGRYTRHCKNDMRSESTTKNIWKIIYRGQMEAIDVSDEHASNWMMFVKPTPTVSQQNVVAFQQRRSIYFVTCRDVQPGSELLLWYAADYVLLLGLPSKPNEFKHCPMCRKSFPSVTALKQHLRYMHPDTTHRKWKCTICEKALETQSKLRIHTLTHVGIKPHHCQYCNKAFSDMSNLRRHESIHTGVKKFQCPQCLKTFRLKSHLQSHALCHTQEKRYQCRFCDTMIARQNDLKKHELQHTQEVPFSCSQCNKTFRIQRNLWRHEKIHTGVKNFACSKCSKRFITRYHRTRHAGKCKGDASKVTASQAP